MKNLILSAFVGAAALMLLSFVTPVFAADTDAVTITGQCTCAKCALHETDKCQNVVQVEKDGKTVNYYLTGKESKAFHENVCKEPKKVTATGTVKEVDGKMTMKVTKIELAN